MPHGDRKGQQSPGIGTPPADTSNAYQQTLYPKPMTAVGHAAAGLYDLTTDEVDYVLENYKSKGVSRSSGRPCLFGYTASGRYITVIYEEEDRYTVIPVTAYEVPEP